MKLFSLMQSLQSLQHLFHEVCNDIFRYSFHKMVNQISHSATIHELYKHEQRLFVVISEKVFCQIGFFTKRHNGNLIFNFFNCSLIFEFNNSTSVIISIFLFFVVGKENFAHSSFSKLSLKYKFFARILLDKLDLIDNVVKLFGCQNFQLNFALLKFNV